MRKLNWALRLSVVLGALFVITDCGTSNNDAISPTATSLYTNLFQPVCFRCHSPATTTYGMTLDFTTASTAYATLFSNVKSTASSNCMSMSIVSPGNARSSYLAALTDPNFVASNYNLPTNCVPPTAYHQGQAPLSAAQYSALVGWIAGGAQNN